MPTYRLGKELGRGALGRVVEVTDLETGEIHAGKLLHDSFRDDPRATERFGREAHLVAGLRHDNVVQVFALASIDGREVIVMERVTGPDLATLLATDGPLPEARLAAIGAGIARGLGAAHQLGLVHRDLKPANVLLGPGEVPKLVDFGLARTTSLAAVDPGAFALVGTPDYMAPESLDPLAVDPRSDLYALGCVLYEMTSGAPPFSGASAFALLDAHRRAPVPALAEGPERSSALVDLITRLLAKSPADRPQSASLVAQELQDIFERRRRPGAELARRGAAGLRTPAVAPERTCFGCGAAVVNRIPVCFACGQALLGLEAGPCTLFVVGPGRTADKLDVRLRHALTDWLAVRPTLGLDPGPLEKQTPRLPFVLATGLSRKAALELRSALAAIGLACAVEDGGALALPEIRKKAWKLTGRATAILLGSACGAFHMLLKIPIEVSLGLALAGGLGIVGGGWQLATRRVTRALPADSPLGPEVARAIDGVVRAVGILRARRHRESLRGVLTRLFAVDEALGSYADGQRELAQAIAAATATTIRLDALEAQLAAMNEREPRPEDRACLLERDRLAGRLLEMTGRLEALRIRLVLAGARERGSGTEAALADLRIEVLALEEVARS